MKKLAESAAPLLMLIYEDGLSMTTIWAVPSAALIPEQDVIYIKKDGTQTYRYDAADLIAAGIQSEVYGYCWFYG